MSYAKGMVTEGKLEDNPAARVHEPSKKDYDTLLADTYSPKYTFMGVGSGGGLLDRVPTTKPSNEKPCSVSSSEETEDHVVCPGVDRVPPTCN